MPLEIATTLHMRDLRSDAPASLFNIAGVVGGWAQCTNPHAIVETGEWNGVGPRNATVTTEKLDLGGDDGWAWTFRFAHPDGDDPEVWWVVTVDVVEVDSRPDTEVAVCLSRESADRRVRLHSANPAAPRLIRDLVEAAGMDCLDGDIPIWAEPRELRHEYIDDLLAMLTSPTRRLPVIGVSEDSARHLLPVNIHRLAERVAGMAHVWFVPDEVTWALSDQLPPRLGVFNAAVRIWWPGFDDKADPYQHHLFLRERRGVEDDVVRLVQTASRDRFMPPEDIAAFRTRLRAREEEAFVRDLEKLAVPGAAVDTELLERLKGELEALREDRDTWQALAGEEERAARRAEFTIENQRAEIARLRLSLDGGDEVDISAFDPEESFLDEVRRAYAEYVCPTPSDREEWPLLAMRLHPEFLGSVDALEGVDRDKIVDVCAQVACDRAWKIGGRFVHPLRDGEAGDLPQRTRATDCASAWRCALQQGTAAARRLHWWRVPQAGDDVDIIEFAHVGHHDDFSIPE